MNLDLSVYLSIAGIAGVFVGFGALISALTHCGGAGGRRMNDLRGLVTVLEGLLVIFAALLPVGLSYYSVSADWFWRVCAIAFLVPMWCSAISSLVIYRELSWYMTWTSDTEFLALFVSWPCIQGPLILCAFAVWVDLAEAFYMTAILVNLLRASMFMVKLVFDALDIKLII